MSNQLTCDEHEDCIIVYIDHLGCPVCNLEKELKEITHKATSMCIELIEKGCEQNCPIFRQCERSK